MISNPAPVVSLVLVAQQRWDDTFRCLMAATSACAGVATETIVVDDATADETRVALAALEGVTAVRNEATHGLAAAMNQGAALARGRYVGGIL